MTAQELSLDIVASLKTGSTEKVILPKMMQDWFKKLTHTELGVLIALYEFVNTVTGSCFAAQEAIGEKLGIDRQATISDAINGLQRKGLIRVAKAKVLRDGKFKHTSNEIFIIPYEKVGNAEYLKEIDDMLERDKFVVVAYIEEGGRTLRKVISTGEHTQCKSPKEMNAYTEVKRQESIKVVETVKVPEKKLPTPQMITDALDGEIWRISMEDDYKKAIYDTLIAAVEETQSFKYEVIHKIKDAIMHQKTIDEIESIIYKTIL